MTLKPLFMGRRFMSRPYQCRECGCVYMPTSVPEEYHCPRCNSQTDSVTELFACTICGKNELWTNEWTWFGNIQSWEAAGIGGIITVCSETCRNKQLQLNAKKRHDWCEACR